MTLLTDLGISSPHEAAELEQDLGIRFSDFTPQDADTWKRQTLYLHQFANTRTFTHAASAAGVSLRHARTWQTDNTLGFNQRLAIAVLEYTEEIEVILLEQVRQPKPSPALLAMLLRAHLPEKYGPARRDYAPRNGQCDHDDPKPETSQEDRDSLEDIRRDLQDPKLFAGPTHPEPTSETMTSTPSLADLPPVGAGFKPAPSPQHPEPAAQPPTPTLNRRQRRQLQRKQRKQLKRAPHPNTGTKQPNSHRPRAPN